MSGEVGEAGVCHDPSVVSEAKCEMGFEITSPTKRSHLVDGSL